MLGSPDNPHAGDYKALMGTATALSDDRWFSCTIRHFAGPLWITHAAERVLGGMSGSSEAGTAIGVVCTTTSPGEGGPNARLSDNLPVWLA